MEMRKWLAGGLSLLLCTVVYGGLCNVPTDLLKADVGSLARLYASAAPHALITPIRLHDDTAIANCSRLVGGAADEPATLAADDRLAEYVSLHKTLVGRLP